MNNAEYIRSMISPVDPWPALEDSLPTEADQCPECGSDNTCEQTREDDPPHACLDCGHEWED